MQFHFSPKFPNVMIKQVKLTFINNIARWVRFLRPCSDLRRDIAYQLACIRNIPITFALKYSRLKV